MSTTEVATEGCLGDLRLVGEVGGDDERHQVVADLAAERVGHLVGVALVEVDLAGGPLDVGDRVARVGVLVDLDGDIHLRLVVGDVAGGGIEVMRHGRRDDVGDDVLVELHARGR